MNIRNSFYQSLITLMNHVRAFSKKISLHWNVHVVASEDSTKACLKMWLMQIIDYNELDTNQIYQQFETKFKLWSNWGIFWKFPDTILYPLSCTQCPHSFFPTHFHLAKVKITDRYLLISKSIFYSWKNFKEDHCTNDRYYAPK